MNTTTAAQQAGVTVPTVRHWCRMGAIRATKTAGRWIIDTTSLARRIAMGTRHTRKAPAMDLTASYTTTKPDTHGRSEVTYTPRVRDKMRHGHRIITVSRLHALLADKLSQIDEYERMHVETILSSTWIKITDRIDDGPDFPLTVSRDRGRLSTNYQGNPHLTTEVILDLAEEIRTHLGV